MYCEWPIEINSMLVRCGRCDTCRASRVSIWANRILLEAEEYESNAFVTLTYNDEALPADGSLVARDLQLFLKRFRKRYVGRRVRFFACGEYGSQFGRPHYHAILFNVPACANGITSYRSKWGGGKLCCPSCYSIQAAWSLEGVELGGIRSGTVEEASARYVAGYILKGATRTDDPRLSGRWPEFSRCSNRPGIGYSAMHDVADTWLRYRDPVGDSELPAVLMRGKKYFPYGRYLKGKLGEMVAIDKEEAARLAVARSQEQLRILRQMAAENEEKYIQTYRRMVEQPVKNWKARQKTRARK